VLVEIHDGKLLDGEVKQLDGPIAAGYEELVLVDLGPGQVVLGIVGIISKRHGGGGGRVSVSGTRHGGAGPLLRLLYLDAGSCEGQGEDLAVAHDAVVGRRGDGDPRIKVWRVLDGIGVEPRRAELEHPSGSHSYE